MKLVKVAAAHSHVIALGIGRAARLKVAGLVPARVATSLARPSLTRSLRPAAGTFHEWSTARAFKRLADAQKEHSAVLASGGSLLPHQADSIRSAVGEARMAVRQHGAHDPRIATVAQRYGFGAQHRDALAGTFHDSLAPDFRRMLAPL